MCGTFSLSLSASFDVPTPKLADIIISPPWRAGIKGWVKNLHQARLVGGLRLCEFAQRTYTHSTHPTPGGVCVAKTCRDAFLPSPSASFDVPTSKLADKIITPPWRAGIKGWVKANHHPPDPLPFRKGKTIMSKAVQKTAQLYSSAEKKMMQNFPADFICDKSLFRLCQ